MTIVRTLFQAVKVEGAATPYDTIHLKVFYPARMSDNPLANNSMGTIPADDRHAPFSVIILFGGINCSAAGYQWLATKLVERGLVVLTFDWVAQNLPGMIGLTPGVNISSMAPDNYGKTSSASALPALLTALDGLNSEGILAGLLNLQQVILGGHSAGGRVAIESASPNFFPQVVAAFAYGAHTAAIVQLGYTAGTILPVPDALPMMLIGGTCDGVIANSSNSYGLTWEQPTTPISRTFGAMTGGRNDRYLLLLAGANHFSIVHPLDPTTGTAFLDFPATQPAGQIRDVIAEAIGLFVDAHVRCQPQSLAALDLLVTSHHPTIDFIARK
jgi:hypothetical protein